MQNLRFRNAKTQLSFFKGIIFTKQEGFLVMVLSKKKRNNYNYYFPLNQ